VSDALWKALGVITMGMDLPLRLWYVTAGLLGFAIWSARSLYLSKRLGTWPMRTLYVGSAVVFIVYPLFAVAFWADHAVDTPETQELPTQIIGVLTWGYVFLLAALVAIAKGHRAQVGALACFMLWMNSGVLLVCIMAISGVWL